MKKPPAHAGGLEAGWENPTRLEAEAGMRCADGVALTRAVSCASNEMIVFQVHELPLYRFICHYKDFAEGSISDGYHVV